MTSADATGEPAARPSKGERTRLLILDTALELFREQGYDETTMRQIAERAGVSVGNAYYYFGSKDELILAFYERNHTDHLAALGDALANETDFQQRLRTVLRTKVDVSMPYRRLATKLFTTAADPESPLSPFSEESSPLRLAAINVLRETIEGADIKVPRTLRADLPELLWLYEMGILLYWVHDTSIDSARTYTLIDRTVPVADRLIGLSRLPVVRPLVRDLLGLLDELRP